MGEESEVFGYADDLGPEIERSLGERGTLVVPGFIANAGGVVAGAVELRKGTVEESFKTAREQIRANVQAMLEEAKADGLLPREAAENLARRRVIAAMKDKGRL